jgi:hypothetical protein
MSEENVKKVCRHGIDQQTCSLCLGLPQSEEKSGPPSWLIDELPESSYEGSYDSDEDDE